jgi:hypothetical protein
MAEFFHGRRLRYQISLLIEGRWQLIAVVEDGRDQLKRPFDQTDLNRLEEKVRMRARAALATPGAKAVRVVRERIRDDGYTAEEPFLHETTTVVKPAERQVSNFAGPMPVCTAYEDLLTRPALRAMGLVMRPLLDRLNLTPVELVTLSATTSAVKRAQAGIGAAIATAARLQAEASKTPVRTRISELEDLAEDCRRRVRAAERAEGLPKLGPIGLDRLVALADRCPAAERRFRALRGLAEHIAEATTYPSKLDRLLELNQPALAAASLELLDEVAACLVDHADVVQVLLGRQADLRAALLGLADFAEGTPPPESEAPEAAAHLALLIAAQKLPKTQDALWDRLARSLDSRRKLTGAALPAEQAAIAALQRDLLPRLPEPFRAEADAALARRQTSVLQSILDEMER